MKTGTWFAAIIILFLALGGVAQGASENHRESLRGITGVCVRVGRLSQNSRQDGLDEKTIQADAEQKLKQAGIAVLTPAQAAQDPSNPILYISVDAKLLYYPQGVTFDPAGRPYNTPPYIVMMNVALLQNVIAARDPSLKLTEEKTWDAGYLTAQDPTLLKKLTRTTLSDLVDSFTADWKAANKK
jgi:hypothetical protein